MRAPAFSTALPQARAAATALASVGCSAQFVGATGAAGAAGGAATAGDETVTADNVPATNAAAATTATRLIGGWPALKRARLIYGPPSPELRELMSGP
ncbi:hypothetical protein Asi03nite_44990 [Actinoplanes siamensis]|uniref:Uncharacterized protein n=1 Tax=Actinoplanes siamensis TaxID=1223317 RepID=A0A919N9V0_9ACTN|nr:hypothetical protein Asi03nite_44990 [Actinoplanes siamensis]